MQQVLANNDAHNEHNNNFIDTTISTLDVNVQCMSQQAYYMQQQSLVCLLFAAHAHSGHLQMISLPNVPQSLPAVPVPLVHSKYT